METHLQPPLALPPSHLEIRLLKIQEVQKKITIFSSLELRPPPHSLDGCELVAWWLFVSFIFALLKKCSHVVDRHLTNVMVDAVHSQFLTKLYFLQVMFYALCSMLNLEQKLFEIVSSDTLVYLCGLS